jgi:hypothetical protein
MADNLNHLKLSNFWVWFMSVNLWNVQLSKRYVSTKVNKAKFD